MARRRPARHLLSGAQRDLLLSVTSTGVDVDGLVVPGPVDGVRLASGRPGRRVIIDSWGFPDGSGIVELALCRPAQSARAAAAVRDLLAVGGIPLARTQESKTWTSMQRLATGPADRCPVHRAQMESPDCPYGYHPACCDNPDVTVAT